jgi:hypothetical protein
MKTALYNILYNMEQFAAFMDQVNIEELRVDCTRQELKEFGKALYDINIRSLAYEVGKVVEQKKIEEYPQLLSIHRFPVLCKIDFLTEAEKISVDKWLGQFLKGYSMRSLYRAIGSKYNQEKEAKLIAFLTEKQVIEPRYYVECLECGDNHISEELTIERKEQFEEALRNGDENVFDNIIVHSNCDVCHYHTYFDGFKVEDITYDTVYKMMIDRDKSLDNV